MASYYKKRGKWVVSFRLKGQARDHVYGIKTESIARQVAAAKTLEEQLVKAGLHTPRPDAAKLDAAAKKAAARHVDDLEKSIVDKGKKPQHAQQTASHVRRLLKMAAIARLDQLEAGPIQAAAKRLIDEEGLAPRTANAAIKAARQFSTWLHGAKRIPVDVLHRTLHTYNEAVDQRRGRRALSADELARLLDATRTRPNTKGMRGLDRFVLYQVAIGTGFRLRACLSLTKASFHVDPKLAHPFVRLAAKFNKNGRDRDQKIRKDLAALLADWLKAKPDAGPVWKTKKHAHLELLVRRDLEAARAAWLKEAGEDRKELERRERSSFLLYQDAAGRFADFHSLRHTGISLVVRRAGLKVAQAWADHSTPVLTAKYAHLDLADEEQALEGLPAAAQPQPVRSAEKSGKGRKETENRKIG